MRNRTRHHTSFIRVAVRTATQVAVTVLASGLVSLRGKRWADD
jgi:hypothetical protein